MRIVGGKYKGRNLAVFKGNEIRPTSDMARESLFNILYNVTDKTFLDLFCGSGAVGIEALSRGAKRVDFNDLSKDSLAVTKKNLSLIGNPINAFTYNYDAAAFLKKDGGTYDIIFIDPPYKEGFNGDILLLCENKLSDSGVIIYESESEFNGEIKGLKVKDRRKYGRARLTFFVKE